MYWAVQTFPLILQVFKYLVAVQSLANCSLQGINQKCIFKVHDSGSKMLH